MSSGFLDYVFGGSFSLGLENPIVANLFKEFRSNNLLSASGCGSPREMPGGQRLPHKRTPEPKINTCIKSGYAVAQLIEALRYKPEGRRFDSLLCQWNILVT
jgi:hypothetical protein